MAVYQVLLQILQTLYVVVAEVSGCLLDKVKASFFNSVFLKLDFSPLQISFFIVFHDIKAILVAYLLQNSLLFHSKLELASYFGSQRVLEHLLLRFIEMRIQLGLSKSHSWLSPSEDLGKFPVWRVAELVRENLSLGNLAGLFLPYHGFFPLELPVQLFYRSFRLLSSSRLICQSHLVACFISLLVLVRFQELVSRLV